MTAAEGPAPKRHWRTTAALLLLALLLILAAPWIKRLVRWADVQWFDETLSDRWADWRHGEDWSGLPPLHTGLSYAWLAQAGNPVLIAHALGESDSPGQNTLGAMQRSLQAGLRILEIDIWLDDQGILRCHHGPSAPPPASAEACTLEQALEVAAAHDAWLVLDIKTDYASTGRLIVQRFARNPAADRLIFQLYRTEDVLLFNQWASGMPLPGPIVTTYLARRSLGHVAMHAQRIGVRAFAFPLERRAAFKSSHGALKVLVHPVHNCAAVRAAQEIGADGFYVTSHLSLLLRKGCT
jgi:glycerophosphoryl diester phosphodiesterase